MYHIFDHCFLLILFQFFYIYHIHLTGIRTALVFKTWAKPGYREAQQQPLFYSLFLFLSNPKSALLFTLLLSI